MQAAFLVLGGFPPPAAGAHVLAGPDGARAGCAANARIAAVVERVVGHGVLADVAPDCVIGPIGQRIELVQSVLSVPFLQRQRATRDRLRAALPGDPRAPAGEGATERLDLADEA